MATRQSELTRAPRPSNLAEVLDLILDKGLVIDAYVRVSATRSATYAYGVLSGKEVPNRGPRGLLGRPVRFVHEGGVAVAVSEVDGPVPGRREDLLTHFGVLEELGARATVLPLRFGTVF